MFVPFDELADTSRLWIYQGSRPFEEDERKEIEGLLLAFCHQWAAHGHALKTSFKIEYNQFLILGADESYHLPSGCSIDSSVRVIKNIQERVHIDFFDRTRVAFRIGEKTVLYPLGQLKEEFTGGTLNAETVTFNNLVATKAEWLQSWLVPVMHTWLSRYLPKDVVAS